MDPETLKMILNLASQSKDVIPPELTGEPKGSYYIREVNDEGNLSSWNYQIVAKLRQHKALGPETVLAFAARFATIPSSIWYSRQEVVALLDDMDNTGLRETCTLKLEFSKPIKKLLELEANPPSFKQLDAIRTLRLFFHGCLTSAGDILLVLRALKFTNNNATVSSVQHGSRNISSTLVSEVTGRNAIPETFLVDVPIFNNAFQGYREQVEIIVDIDDATETIRLVPAPGAIEHAIANAEDRIGKHLRDELPGYMTPIDSEKLDDDDELPPLPPVYYGTVQ